MGKEYKLRFGFERIRQNQLDHYETVKLWALLEYLCQNVERDIKEIDYSSSIACFWDREKNLKCIAGKFQIGNLLLGNSWCNNKSRWVEYTLPQMEKIHKATEFSIKDVSIEYIELIDSYLNKTHKTNK